MSSNPREGGEGAHDLGRNDVRAVELNVFHILVRTFEHTNERHPRAPAIDPRFGRIVYGMRSSETSSTVIVPSMS
jgi:hypothetical protein